MQTQRRAFAGLAVAGFMAGLASLVVVLQSSHVSDTTSAIVFGPAVGWSFIAAGLIAWSRRPGNRFGVLMTSVGFAWFAGALAVADERPIFVAGVLLSAIPYGLLVHMLLTLPDGSLSGRFDRAVAALNLASCTIGQWLPLLIFDTRRLDCECPRQSLLVPADPGAERLVFSIQAAAALLIVIGLVAAIVRRARRREGRRAAELRSLAPIGAVVAALLVATMLARISGMPEGVRGALRVVSLGGFLLIPFAFLAGVLRSRLSRGAALAALISQLTQTAGAHTGLRDALAEALGDPSVTLAYWVPDQQRYVDAEGRPVVLGDGLDGRRWTAITRDGRPVAAILHAADLDAESELVRAAGAAAGLSLENERLTAELRAHVEELRASRTRVVEAGLAERRRLERDLHDGAQQRLVSVALTLGLARGRARDDDAMAELLQAADEQLEGALDELRELARGIHPPLLSDRGLDGALQALASRAPLPVQITAAPDQRLPDSLESAVYFTVAEALTNTARYARASHATVDVARHNGTIVIEVADDGVGGADADRGSGLRGLADRLGALGGHLTIDSEPEHGTTIRGWIPCE